MFVWNIMCQITPLFLRDVYHYRFWLRTESDPTILRDVGLIVCDDLEESLILLDELGHGDAPGQMELEFDFAPTLTGEPSRVG